MSATPDSWQASLEVAARVRAHLAAYPDAGVAHRRVIVAKLLATAASFDAIARGAEEHRVGAVASCVYLSAVALAMYTGDHVALASLRREIEQAARGN